MGLVSTVTTTGLYDVTDLPRTALGSLLEDQDGRIFRYVQALIAVTEGQILRRVQSSFVGLPATGTATRVQTLGAAQWEIGAGQYGFVLCKGVGSVDIAGTLSPEEVMVSGGGLGKATGLSDVLAGDPSFLPGGSELGTNLSVSVITNTIGQVYIDCL